MLLSGDGDNVFQDDASNGIWANDEKMKIAVKKLKHVIKDGIRDIEPSPNRSPSHLEGPSSNMERSIPVQRKSHSETPGQSIQLPLQVEGQ